MADGAVEKIGFEVLFESKSAQSAALALERGLGGITKAMSGLGTMAVAKGMLIADALKAMSGLGTMAVAKGMLIADALKSFGRGLVSNLVSAMPMIGVAMDAMKQVIVRNLVYPLAQQVLPVLLEMLQWVRENRIGFVQLGTVLANVFRVGVSIIRSFFTIVGSLVKGFMDHTVGMQSVFSTLMDYLNLALFKIAWVLTLVSVMIEDSAESIGSAIRGIWDNAGLPYIQGFLTGALYALLPILDSIRMLLDELFGGTIKGDLTWIRGAFYVLGRVIAAIVFGPLMALVNTVRTVVALWTFWISLVTAFGRLLRDIWADPIGAIRRFGDEVGAALGGLKSKIFSIFTNFFKSIFGEDFIDSIYETVTKGFSKAFKWVKDHNPFTGIDPSMDMKGDLNGEKKMGREDPIVTPEDVSRGTGGDSVVNGGRTEINNNVHVNVQTASDTPQAHGQAAADGTVKGLQQIDQAKGAQIQRN